jgi:hypothetical protein
VDEKFDVTGSQSFGCKGGHKDPIRTSSRGTLGEVLSIEMCVRNTYIYTYLCPDGSVPGMDDIEYFHPNMIDFIQFF